MSFKIMKKLILMQRGGSFKNPLFIIKSFILILGEIVPEIPSPTKALYYHASMW